MNNNDLNGTLVLVHTYLESDAAKKQGQVGVLTYAASGDEIYVTFRDKSEGVYKSDDLFHLKEREELFSAMADPAAIGLDGYKDMYKIGLLQDSGRSTDLLRALEIAGNNPAIWEQSLTRLDSLIAPNLEHSLSR